MSRFDHHQPEYHAFLLRLWRDDARRDWHASLQSTGTGQLFHFRTLDELFTYLDSRLEVDDGERWPPPNNLNRSRSTDAASNQHEADSHEKGG